MFNQLSQSLKRLSIRGRDALQGKPLVTVFGATGAQGSSVAASLLESRRFRVRGVCRNTDSERAKKLREGGAEVVHADMGNKEEVLRALQGAYAAYVVTDFWSVREREFEMGKLAVECAKEAGVKHLIWSTLPDTAKFSGGEISVPHFVSKAKVDAVVQEAGFEHYTFVMCSFYFQNFAQFGFTILETSAGKEGEVGGPGEGAGAAEGATVGAGTEEVLGEAQGVDVVATSGGTMGGTAEGSAGSDSAVQPRGSEAEFHTPEGSPPSAAAATVVFKLPLDADAMLTAFDVDDTGGAVLAILEHPEDWNGKHVCLAGFHAPAAEYVHIFEKVKGKPARYEHEPTENEEFAEMFKWLATKTVFGPYDITNGRKCYPKIKSWDEWLETSGWDGPTASEEAAKPVEEEPQKTE